jgi:hypothetical protein
MLKRRNKGEKGQALIEFIMIIPIIMTFMWYLIHVSFAINKSIVGQVATRSQLFLKMYNHRSGPVVSEFGRTERSHFYIGVSSEVVKGNTKPTAPVEVLGIGPNPKRMNTANDDPGEPEGGSPRQNIRVRTVFGICTHRKHVKGQLILTNFCGADPSGDSTPSGPPPPGP